MVFFPSMKYPFHIFHHCLCTLFQCCCIDIWWLGGVNPSKNVMYYYHYCQWVSSSTFSGSTWFNMVQHIQKHQPDITHDITRSSLVTCPWYPPKKNIPSPTVGKFSRQIPWPSLKRWLDRQASNLRELQTQRIFFIIFDSLDLMGFNGI